jgi:hypothetical protein
LYRQRADYENRIKGLKEDFGFDSFNLKEFWETEAAITVAIFRMFVYLSQKICISCPSYGTKYFGAFFQTKMELMCLILLWQSKDVNGYWALNQSNQIDTPFICPIS